MKKFFTAKSLILSGLLIAVLAIGAGALYMRAANNQSDQSAGGTNEDNTAGPPTAEEQAAGDQQKANLPDQPAQPATPQPAGRAKSVKPIITSSGQTSTKLEVAARVPGIVEDGGKCTLKMSRGGKTVSAARQGASNVSEVSCGYIGIALSSLSPGDWQATVSYSSNKAKGTSDPETITVQ